MRFRLTVCSGIILMLRSVPAGAVPVVVTVGSASSQAGLTVSLK